MKGTKGERLSNVATYKWVGFPPTVVEEMHIWGKTIVNNG